MKKSTVSQLDLVLSCARVTGNSNREKTQTTETETGSEAEQEGSSM